MPPGAVTVYSPNLNQTDPHSKTKEREAVPGYNPNRKKQGLSVKDWEGIWENAVSPGKWCLLWQSKPRKGPGHPTACFWERCQFQPLENRGDYRLFRRSSRRGEGRIQKGLASSLTWKAAYQFSGRASSPSPKDNWKVCREFRKATVPIMKNTVTGRSKCSLQKEEGSISSVSLFHCDVYRTFR